MEYSALHIGFDNTIPDTSDIVIAVLDDMGFEGITETEKGLIAYIPSQNYSETLVKSVLDGLVINDKVFIYNIELEIIEQQNWNALWESNFEPAIITDECVVRAPFHESFEGFKYRLTIEPKMSFGTGHHETTSLMLTEILDLELKDKSVLDMGCGTGVLAILAFMKGAQPVTAIDYDNWCYINSMENAAVNNANIKVIEGGKEVIPNDKFDVILANINRNILLDQLEIYSSSIVQGGTLLLSGILHEDFSIINDSAESKGFEFVHEKSKGKWIMLRYTKK